MLAWAGCFVLIGSHTPPVRWDVRSFLLFTTLVTLPVAVVVLFRQERFDALTLAVESIVIGSGYPFSSMLHGPLRSSGLPFGLTPPEALLLLALPALVISGLFLFGTWKQAAAVRSMEEPPVMHAPRRVSLRNVG
jgi:hypothetical protein